MMPRTQTTNISSFYGVWNVTWAMPDECPICHNNIQPIESQLYSVHDNWIERVLRCPAEDCRRIFVAKYSWNHRPGYADVVDANLFELTPFTIKTKIFDEYIKSVSTDFLEIYKQADEAEQRGLLLVCGPGYRKALEFLIKDYVSRMIRDKVHSNDSTANKDQQDSLEIEKIKKMNLSSCINEFVTDVRIKKVASRAVWLGNDETHYLRKWEDKDLRDLKNLIDLTVHWIKMEELTQKTLEDMPEGKA